jgi:hypothetical protein
MFKVDVAVEPAVIVGGLTFCDCRTPRLHAQFRPGIMVLAPSRGRFHIRETDRTSHGLGILLHPESTCSTQRSLSRAVGSFQLPLFFSSAA